MRETRSYGRGVRMHMYLRRMCLVKASLDKQLHANCMQMGAGPEVKGHSRTRKLVLMQ